MQIEHTIGRDFLNRPVRMLVIGAGGTGSAFLLHLPYLHQALLAWGHPHGLDVTVADGDVVTETNCVRQPFAACDVGLNKAVVLASRINLFWGLGWNARPEPFGGFRDGVTETPQLVVSCVDTRAARRLVHKAVTDQNRSVKYWLDIGNNASSGQYVLGQPLNGMNRQGPERLRTVAELYPEVLAEEEDPQPSCSAAEALNRQEPFVNQMLALASLSMLTRLFRYGRIGHQGGFWSAQMGTMVPLTIDPEKRAAQMRRERRRLARLRAAAA